MKNKFKKIVATVAAIAVALTTVVVTDVTTAQAAEYDDLYMSASAENGAAGVENKYNFTVNNAGKVYFQIATTEYTGITVTLYNSTGGKVEDANNPLYISSTDEVWTMDSSTGYAINGDMWELPAGDYTYGVKFDTDHQYLINIYQEKPSAKISDSKATVTIGFTKKLSVSGSKVTKWSSSKKSVATVDSKGKVTAKKTGKATISAKCENGQTVKCVVTVKANKYTASKISVGQVTYGKWGMEAYSASFDSKGNLVVKVRIANNTTGRLTQIRSLKVTVKNGSGKTVAKYSTSKKNISVPAYSTKDTSFTIAKSKVKKVDLRNATITCSGNGYGY